MNKKPKVVPQFKSEAAERAFWETHDSAELVDWSKAERVILPKLKPTTQSISLRLPLHLLERIKSAANARDVPLPVADQGLARGKSKEIRMTATCHFLTCLSHVARVELDWQLSPRPSRLRCRNYQQQRGPTP